jgi:hypothetical protein
MSSLDTTLTNFLHTYKQIKSENPTQHTELEFRIGRINANNNFKAGYVVPEIKSDDTLVDPEKNLRELQAFDRLRSSLEQHAISHPSHWTITPHPQVGRAYYVNDLRQSITQDPPTLIIERKTPLKQLMIHSNGVLQIRAAISLEQQFDFKPNSPEAIALKQNKPKAMCLLLRTSFTERIDSQLWGTVTFRYDLTKVSPKRQTKDKCCGVGAQYHGELELVSYPDLFTSPDHTSYFIHLLVVRFRFLLGNCLVTISTDQPPQVIATTPLPHPILYCHE